MPEVYTDLAKSQQISKDIAALTNKIEAFNQVEKVVTDALELVELAEEENDQSMFEEIEL